MTQTAILWIDLAILALAILVIIGILCHRVNRASTVFVGYLATDKNGDVFLYGLRPKRNVETGMWEQLEGDDAPLLVPAFMHASINPPTWEREPLYIELWASHLPDPASTVDITPEDNDLF